MPSIIQHPHFGIKITSKHVSYKQAEDTENILWHKARREVLDTPELLVWETADYKAIQIIGMKTAEQQYSISDLSRALLRDFLTQKGLKKTLQAFEKEDLSNKKKISKNLLIEMVSLKSLFLINRQSTNPLGSLLEILVAYLNRKYTQKSRPEFITTQPNFSNPRAPQSQHNEHVEVKNKAKERPVSSKPFRGNQLEAKKLNPPVQRQKEELKVIYQKLSKKEDSKQFRIVEASVPRKTEPAKTEEKAKTEEPEAKKQTIQPQVKQADQDYQQGFEEEDQPVQVLPLQKLQPLPKVQPQPIITQKPIAKKDNQPQKEPRKSEEKPLQKNISQQLLNPTPISHVQSKPAQVINNKQPAKIMGCADIPKVQQKVEPPPPPIAVQVQEPPKARTEMRMLRKQINDTSSKKIEPPPQVKPQPKKQEQPQAKAENIQTVNSPISLLPISKQQKIEPAPVAAPVMVTLGKKKKAKQEVSDTNYPTKFKFDQNFTHEIPKELTYQYKEYGFQGIVISEEAQQLYPSLIFSPAINYKQKGGGVPPGKKRVEKLIASKDAERLKKVVFQSSPSVLPKSWSQGFILSPHQQTPYGLKQIQGGPCGIIAAVQCYFLKHLMLCSKQNQFKDETLREVCLVAAIANMLWKVKSTDKIHLAFPPKGATKVEISNLRTVVIEANDFAAAFAGVWSSRDEYIGNTNHGVAALLYSVVLTKGPDNIQAEMDIKENPLIGNHGHCTQQFVNLVLTGQACSNCFDGDKILDDYKLKGIAKKSQFGFLTIFQALRYIQVGKNLKNPIFPAWVICKEFHYHVIFAPHYLIAENNKSPKFDIVYFDGLYNCGDRIRITLQSVKEEQEVKTKDLPLIQQVMMTKWGKRVACWNGSTKIL